MRITLPVLATTVIALVALGGKAMAQVPKPGPDQARLNYFTGNWTTEAELKPGAFGPGGKFTSQDQHKWMAGGFFVVLHSDWKGAMGPGSSGSSLAVMGYNSEERVYTYDEFNSMGESVHSTGIVKGDTWTWDNVGKVGGKSFKGRFMMKILSPASYSIKYEIADGAGAWTTVMEGKTTKTG